MAAELGVILNPSSSIDECVGFAKLAEDERYDYVLLADSPLYTRDTAVALTAVAQATRTIRLGTAVTNPYTRHPVMIASLGISIHEISGSRMLLGLGAGESAPASVGINIKNSINTVKETVRICRTMFKGEPVDVHGDRTVTLNPKLVNGPHHIPIYLAAASAPMITLAGEIADGVILSSFFGRHLNYAKRLLEEGVTKAGREKSSVKICNAAYLSVARNSDKAVDLARDICVKLIKGTKFPLLEMCGIDRELYEATLKATREGDFESTRKLMHSGIVDNLVVAGDPNECAKKCNDLFANGVELLLFNQPYGPDKQEALRLIRQYLETGSLMHP